MCIYIYICIYTHINVCIKLHIYIYIHIHMYRNASQKHELMRASNYKHPRPQTKA